MFLGLLEIVISCAEHEIGRRALLVRRRLTERFAGALASENPGMSNELQVRILNSEISKVSAATLFDCGLVDPNMRPV